MIIFTAEDGSVNNYKLRIIKVGDSQGISNGLSYIVLVGLISLALGTIVVKISDINNYNS